MMITDLIDQDDYFEFLQGAGVPLETGLTPEQCSLAALSWLKHQSEEVCQQFEMSLYELKDKTPIMLPEVQIAFSHLINGC